MGAQRHFELSDDQAVSMVEQSVHCGGNRRCTTVSTEPLDEEMDFHFTSELIPLRLECDMRFPLVPSAERRSAVSMYILQ